MRSLTLRSVSWLMLSGVASGCSRHEASTAAESSTTAHSAVPGATHAATPVVHPAGPVAVPMAAAGAQTQNVGPLAITTRSPVVYRWSDGDWIVRLTVSVRNTGTTPVDVDRQSFHANDFTPWRATFADHTTVNPGLTLEGDVEWFAPGSFPQPQTFTVSYRPGGDDQPVLAARLFSPIFSPAPPADGMVPAHILYSLPVTATGGLTFVHTDGDRVVRVAVSITNPTGVLLHVPLAYLQAQMGGTDGTQWGQATTLADPIDVAPDATVTGTVAWYWNGDHGAPATVAFTFGAPHAPQVTASVPVTAGPSPLAAP